MYRQISLFRILKSTVLPVIFFVLYRPLQLPDPHNTNQNNLDTHYQIQPGCTLIIRYWNRFFTFNHLLNSSIIIPFFLPTPFFNSVPTMAILNHALRKKTVCWNCKKSIELLSWVHSAFYIFTNVGWSLSNLFLQMKWNHYDWIAIRAASFIWVRFQIAIKK